MKMNNDYILRTKYYDNERVRQFVDLAELPQYKPDGNEIKLLVDKKYIYSGPFTPGNEKTARDQCAALAITELELLLGERGYYNKRKIIILSVIGGFLLLSILFILLLPFLFGGGQELAISKANRVIVKFEYSPIIINKFEQHVYYLNQGDINLIKKQIVYDNSTLDPNYFSAIANKQILLAIVKNEKYPTYVIPPGMGVGIRFNNVTNQYSIDLLTKERDGIPKRYVNLNVCENAFDKIDLSLPQYQKNYIFSKYGTIVMSNSYITKLSVPKPGTLKWWTTVQSLYFQYFFQLFKSNDYAKQDKSEGFDNFAPVDINNPTFAC